MQIKARVQCPVYDSFRVQQVAGMFDVPIEKRAAETFVAELPDAEEVWKVGCIVGPSGSGKSTLAREAYGDCLYTGFEWPRESAVIDGFGELSVKEITHMLTAVGFSSPPAWVKPYAVLSNGQKFRCDLARALLSIERAKEGEPLPIIAFDEFTSVVDRTVAKIGSAAVAKAVRNGTAACRFVAVTCHYDVAEWLEADWVFDTASGTLARGRLRRPEISLEIFPASHAAWALFKRDHYLSGSIPAASRIYIALWNKRPVGCVVVGNYFGRCNLGAYDSARRISRIVVLPDFQGIGIGRRLLTTIGELLHKQRIKTTISTSQPAMIALLKASKDWKITEVKHKHARRIERHAKHGPREVKTAQGRSTVSAVYTGQEVLNTCEKSA